MDPVRDFWNGHHDALELLVDVLVPAEPSSLTSLSDFWGSAGFKPCLGPLIRCRIEIAVLSIVHPLLFDRRLLGSLRFIDALSDGFLFLWTSLP
jgi:hypothetical protein